MTPPDVRAGPGSAPRPTAVRTARISWLTDPPGGHAGVSVGSRAFTALPMAFSGPEGEPEVTNPGELMAAAHGSALAVILARILVRGGLPAHELVVAATYTFAGDWYEVAEVALRIDGRVPGCEPARFEHDAREAVDRCAESFGTVKGPRVTVTARLW